MRTPLPDGGSLWDLTRAAGLSPRRFVSDASGRVALADLAEGNSLGAPSSAFFGRSVLVSCERQLPAVLALLQLDGVARRILLCPPDLAPGYLAAVIAEAGVDVVVSDGGGPAAGALPAGQAVGCSGAISPGAVARGGPERTEWVLFTSGTVGRPKMVVHSMRSLTVPLDDGLLAAGDAIWSTFYDVRRYGGLQILLRALLGGGAIVLSQAGEAVADFLARAGRSGVTHISGTPSHWRGALMSAAAGHMAPRYVRLSGELADQAILNSLAATYPDARLGHAFASTEAGVAFDVRDGKAGFPASLVDQAGAKVDMRIVDGSLRIRSPRTASRYLGAGGALLDADGFVDTGDMVERRADRYHFIGRREGVINVGGLKVHPEEVEAVINQHPCVRIARVRGRASPITGAIVVADIVVRSPAAWGEVADDILSACRRALPPHKVPAVLREVPSLEIAGSGKMVRARA